MKRRNSGRLAAAIAAALAMWTRLASAQPPDQPMESGVFFTAEVTITQAIVDRTGKPTRELPPSRYRLDRFDGGRLRTTMLATRESPAQGPLADAYAGVTVDTDPATGGLRVRDARGTALSVPGPVPAAPAADDVEADLIVTPADRAQRLAALARQFGRPLGSVRSLQRYVGRRGRTIEEVLVAPDTGAIVEMNRLEDGVLVEHHRFEYAPIGGGRLARVRTRSESALPQTPDRRLVAVTTLSAIRVAGGER